MASFLAQQSPWGNAVRHDRFHGRVGGAGRGCDRPGCQEAGEFRAPGPRGSSFDGDAIEAEAALWAQMVREYQILISLVVHADIVPAMLEAYEAEIRGLSYDDYIKQSWLGKEPLTDKQTEIYDNIAKGRFDEYFNSELAKLPEVTKDAATERGDLAQDRSGERGISDGLRAEVSDTAGIANDGGTSETSEQPQEPRARPASDNSLF